MKEAGAKGVSAGLRTGHLLRITGYLDMAILSMWMSSPRAKALMGMALASIEEKGPGGSEEDLLQRLRALVREAIEHHVADDFPAAMARMRVAHDLVALRIVAIADE